MSNFSKIMARSGFSIIKHTFHYSRRPKTWGTALAGVSSMEAFFLAAPKVGLSRVDYATSNGTFFLSPGRNAALVGEFMFYLGAVGWVSLFSTLRPKIKGAPEIQALKFGIMIYLLSSVVVLPVTGLTNPYMRLGILKRPGLFGLGLNGWKTAVSNFIGHMIFSQVIGLKR